ncbi:DNA repair protein RAD51 homolog 3-like [Tachypleus tridentatus]|uniref:DNA repair protein RAD51 homolog 3-like n=1 Tax=Tachypleus tridentatus TaxID=6853 RepID=UPI003FD562F0
MQKEIGSFPLAPHVRFKLTKAGFTTLEDLKGITERQLCNEANLTYEETREVFHQLFSNSIDYAESDKEKHEDFAYQFFSAFDLSKNEKDVAAIITFSQKVDEMIGGGIHTKKLTEICGPSGIGKTQICLQLSVNVQIPESCGGVGGEAIYIDTEGSFIVERLLDIASATVEHIDLINARHEGEGQKKKLNIEDILKGIHYYRCQDYVELLAIVNILPDFLERHSKVRLVIVDSIAFPFRYGYDENFGLRTKLLNSIGQSFMRLASKYNLAVVLTNQMTTKMDEFHGSNLVPSLGENWGHVCSMRLLLLWEKDQRNVLLYKSSWKKDSKVPFKITALKQNILSFFKTVFMLTNEFMWTSLLEYKMKLVLKEAVWKNRIEAVFYIKTWIFLLQKDPDWAVNSFYLTIAFEENVLLTAMSDVAFFTPLKHGVDGYYSSHIFSFFRRGSLENCGFSEGSCSFQMHTFVSFSVDYGRFLLYVEKFTVSFFFFFLHLFTLLIVIMAQLAL